MARRRPVCRRRAVVMPHPLSLFDDCPRHSVWDGVGPHRPRTTPRPPSPAPRWRTRRPTITAPESGSATSCTSRKQAPTASRNRHGEVDLEKRRAQLEATSRMLKRRAKVFLNKFTARDRRGPGVHVVPAPGSRKSRVARTSSPPTGGTASDRRTLARGAPGSSTPRTAIVRTWRWTRRNPRRT